LGVVYGLPKREGVEVGKTGRCRPCVVEKGLGWCLRLIPGYLKMRMRNQARTALIYEAGRLGKHGRSIRQVPWTGQGKAVMMSIH